MQVWEQLADVPADWPSSALTAGVFDGVHRGHRELIRTTIDRAHVYGMPSMIVTFWPNPIEVVGRGAPPTRLCTLRQRLALLEGLGADSVMVLPFTPEFATVTAEEFITQVLSGPLKAGLIVVGENFRFGNRAKGDVDLLQEMGNTHGFSVEAARLIVQDSDGQPVSSTMIREQISAGDVAAASRALARPHRIEGIVVKGDGRGTDLGFPTANVEATKYAAVPADGVYAGRLILDPYGPSHESLCAAISVGTNPTFEGTQRRVEAFAYDAQALDIYGQQVAIDFVARIRDQERFGSSEELVAAVERDIDHARAALGG